MTIPRARIKLFCLAVALLTGCVHPTVKSTSDNSDLPMLKVTGNRLTTATGDAVHLQGVDIPSLEWGQGDHLTNSLQTALDWGANIIRLPLCEDRWFGRTSDSTNGAAEYQKTVEDFVNRAAAGKCYVILDLHWSDANVWGRYIGQHNMPDDNSVAFWKDVSARFANNPAVLFDLYNEPHDISWEVWRNGGDVHDAKVRVTPSGTPPYHTPGLQKLLETCRSTGAKNVVVAGGLDWSYDLRGIADGYALDDSSGNGVVYDTHIYSVKPWYTHGNTKSQDWDRLIMSTGNKYPVMVGEFGGGTNNYAATVLEFARQNDLPWIAWCLHPHARPCLILNWTYAPTTYGKVVKDALHEATAKE
jgi:endoglucanase